MQLQQKRRLRLKQKRKKPTMNQVENVVGSLLIDMRNIVESVRLIDAALTNYIEMQGDTKKLNEYIAKKVKEQENERDTNTTA